MRIIQLVQKNKHIKLAGNDKLRIERAMPEVKDRAQMVRDILRSLGIPLAPVPKENQWHESAVLCQFEFAPGLCGFKAFQAAPATGSPIQADSFRHGLHSHQHRVH